MQSNHEQIGHQFVVLTVDNIITHDGIIETVQHCYPSFCFCGFVLASLCFTNGVCVCLSLIVRLKD